MKKQTSRHEFNKIVRQIFLRHNANLEELSIQCGKSSIHLEGHLVRSDKTDFTAEMLLSLLGDLQRYARTITTNLSNWDFNNWNIVKLKKVLVGQSEAKKFTNDSDEEIEFDL